MSRRIIPPMRGLFGHPLILFHPPLLFAADGSDNPISRFIHSAAVFFGLVNFHPGVIALGAVLLLCGAPAFWLLSFRPLLIAQKARNWPVVDAETTESYVFEDDGGEEEGATWEARIRFRYRYQGRNYARDTIGFMPMGKSSNRQVKEELVRRFSLGTVHPCHVNPESPKEAILIFQNGKAVFRGLVLLGGFLLPGIPLIVLGTYSR